MLKLNEKFDVDKLANIKKRPLELALFAEYIFEDLKIECSLINQKNKRTCNAPIEGLCLQPDVFSICKCLFDEVEKIQFYQVTCHEDILLLLTSLTDQSRHLYSVSLAFLREGAILCTSYIWVFMIVTDGKRICSHFKAELKIDEKI